MERLIGAGALLQGGRVKVAGTRLRHLEGQFAEPGEHGLGLEAVGVIAPGAVRRTYVELTNAAWWVVPVGNENATPRPLTEISNAGWPPPRFRLEYRAPSAEVTRALPQAAAIWRGRLLSPAFTPLGNVD